MQRDRILANSADAVHVSARRSNLDSTGLERTPSVKV
jgi:hypothetical protein